MNLQIARIHIRSAGHPDARAEDVTLDLRGTTGNPEHSLLWLRNAGGKTTLVRLLFALLQPDASARIGSEETGRRSGGLVEYVRADDTAHVVIEWCHAQGALLDDGWRLLTGFAAEWRGTPTRSVSDLARIWYTLEGKGDGVLIERLPFLTETNGERRRLRLNAYREQLAALFKNESVVHTVQADWVQHLDDLGIDRMLVRYMSQMNRNEAGASAIATWRDETEFVRSFVETAVEPGRLQRIDQEVEAVMAKVRRLPEYELQLRFERALHEVLVPLAWRVREADVAEREHRSASSDAALLRGGLEARAAREEQRADDAKSRRDEQQRAYEQHQAEDNRWTDIAREHERDAAAFARDEVEASFAAAEYEKASRAAEVTAWQATDEVVRDRRLREMLAAAELAAATERQRFRPLEDKRDAAALHLALAYQAAVTDAEVGARAAVEDAQRERTRAQDEQQQANAAGVEAATLLAQVASKEERLEEAREKRTRAVSQQHLGPEEQTEVAIARVQDNLNGAIQEHDAANTEIDQLATERAEIAVAAAADMNERSQHERTIGEVRPKLQAASSEGEKIGTDPLAREVAELGDDANLDLDIVGHDIVARLTERQQTNERRERELDLGAALDRHALESIERDRLLPAPTLVEQALEALANAGLRGALAGTRYAAEAMNEADRARALETHPELLAGIVFTDPELLKRAEHILAAAQLPLNAPLVVGLAEDLHTQERGTRRGFVLSPLEASWDRDAAEMEGQRLTAALRATDEQRQDLQHRASDARRLADRVTAYLDEYGNGNFMSLRARLANAQTAIERTERGEAERARRLATITAREHDLHLRMRDLVDTRTHCARTLVVLSELRANEVRTAGLAEGIEKLRAEAQGYRELAERASAAADAARARAERSLDDARNLRAVASEQRTALAALPAAARDGAKRASQPKTGDVATIRSRYEALDQQLRERMDASEALRAVARYQLEVAESEANLARLDRSEPGVVARARELLALPQANTSQGREEALRAARQEGQRAEAAWAAATSLRDAAVEKLNELEEQIRASRRPRRLAETDRAADLTSANLRAADAKRHSEHEKAQQAAAEQTRNEVEAERRDAESAKERISSLVVQLANFDVDVPMGDHVAISGTPTELAQRSQTVVERLRIARSSHQHGQTARTEADADLLRVLGRSEFAALGPTNRLHGMLSSMAPTERAARVDDLVIEVTTLIDSIERELASAEKDLELATTVVAEAVDDTLSLLHTAQRSSKMPSTLRGWAGEPFIVVKFPKTTPEETKAALRPFVKSLVQQKVPTAEELIVQAIGRSVGKVSVEILKPNEGFEMRRVPITELATFSGGQRATSAIALMLMFSELRHRSRAATRAASIGTLVLDNPLGNANAGFLLDVQLAVARAAGIQLVYLTGISDEAALRRFPNIVALSNDAAKRTNWHYIRVNDALRRLLSPDDLADGGRLTAAHVAMPAVETTTT